MLSRSIPPPPAVVKHLMPRTRGKVDAETVAVSMSSLRLRPDLDPVL